jgi:REP element-mobilizing transposase RayT
MDASMLRGLRFHRRRLPHLEREGSTYYVTFSTHKRRVLSPAARSVVLDCCTFVHKRTAFVHIAVVMPDHVHLLLTPLQNEHGEAVPLGSILRTVKGVSARRVNQTLRRSGGVWQPESFDHLLRQEEFVDAKIAYIAQNPVRRGLVKYPRDYEWLWKPGSDRPD